MRVYASACPNFRLTLTQKKFTRVHTSQQPHLNLFFTLGIVKRFSANYVAAAADTQPLSVQFFLQLLSQFYEWNECNLARKLKLCSNYKGGGGGGGGTRQLVQDCNLLKAKLIPMRKGCELRPYGQSCDLGSWRLAIQIPAPNYILIIIIYNLFKNYSI